MSLTDLIWACKRSPYKVSMGECISNRRIPLVALKYVRASVSNYQQTPNSKTISCKPPNPEASRETVSHTRGLPSSPKRLPSCGVPKFCQTETMHEMSANESFLLLHPLVATDPCLVAQNQHDFPLRACKLSLGFGDTELQAKSQDSHSPSGIPHAND